MASATIDLVDPFVIFDKRLEKIVLKEPSGALYTQLGEPRILVRMPDNSAYWVEQPETSRAYLDKLLDVEGGASVLMAMSLADSMQVKAAFFGFFTQAAAKASEKNKTA